MGLVGFAVTLFALALIRQPALGYPIVFLVGVFYFGTVTSVSTVLQQRLDDAVRGRVMALWIMAFGGTVPIGAMVAGPVSDVIGITGVMLAGVVVGLVEALAGLVIPPAFKYSVVFLLYLVVVLWRPQGLFGRF